MTNISSNVQNRLIRDVNSSLFEYFLNNLGNIQHNNRRKNENTQSKIQENWARKTFINIFFCLLLEFSEYVQLNHILFHNFSSLFDRTIKKRKGKTWISECFIFILIFMKSWVMNWNQWTKSQGHHTVISSGWPREKQCSILREKRKLKFDGNKLCLRWSYY